MAINAEIEDAQAASTWGMTEAEHWSAANASSPAMNATDSKIRPRLATQASLPFVSRFLNPGQVFAES